MGASELWDVASIFQQVIIGWVFVCVCVHINHTGEQRWREGPCFWALVQTCCWLKQKSSWCDGHGMCVRLVVGVSRKEKKVPMKAGDCWLSWHSFSQDVACAERLRCPPPDLHTDLHKDRFTVLNFCSTHDSLLRRLNTRMYIIACFSLFRACHLEGRWPSDKLSKL